MAEIENVNNKANVGVTLGGVGLGVALLNAIHNGGGFLSGLFGCGAGNMANAAATVMCGSSAPISRYEFEMGQKISQKDTEIALLKSEQNTEIKIADVYSKLKGDMQTMERSQNNWNSQQMVNNAAMSAAIAANANSIGSLQKCCDQITKVVIPNTSVCPGWGSVNVTPTPAA